MEKLDNLFEKFYQKTIEDTDRAAGPVERKLSLKRKLETLLGDFSCLDEMRIPIRPKTVKTEKFDTYIRELVYLPITDDIEIKTYILTPLVRENKYPSVLAIHGHGYGVGEAVGITETGEENTELPGIHQNFAVQLVKRGMKVFVPEVLGFGERLLERDKREGKQNSCEAMATNLLLEGKTLAGLRVWEARQVLDYMEACGDVKSNKIGMMGFSGGGVITAYTAVLDQRIQVSVLAGFTNTFKGSIMAMHHCIDNYVPGILRYAELPEIISLIAPRALFIEAGENDPLFPVKHVKEAIKQIEPCYENRNELFGTDIFPGEHEISGRKSYDWLHLKLLEV
ncbi:dienelactone hydrolase family protein [Saliterribacillus persicus]|uniref:Dienelactone hydrolase n=1 Tax=Saliterribacillus persicus TaxID=930114 RepID=A0A368Y3A6_9BACI|nr:alpha/beta hydrolase family protein [Saliterribacillus persicus]RCW74763.1 dienelactone hydrolase [Saliterribacillus persicus]